MADDYTVANLKEVEDLAARFGTHQTSRHGWGAPVDTVGF